MDAVNHTHSGLGITSPPPSAMSGPMHMRRKMMMHMTFFWGKNAEVLFTGWPGRNTKMYFLSLAFAFAMCFVVECLSPCRVLKFGPNRNFGVGLAQTLMHTVRMGVAYMAMLAVMSFNGGVFLAAVAGHVAGFLLFGSRAFRKVEKHALEKSSDLPPVSC